VRRLALLLVLLSGPAWAAGGPDYERGNRCFDQGDMGCAIEAFTAALAADPTDASSLNNRGNAWRRRGDLDRAIADYTAAVTVSPDYPLAWRNRGNTWRQAGDLLRAVADYDTAIRQKPDWPHPRFGRAWARFGLGQWWGGATDLTTACALSVAWGVRRVLGWVV
jgi:tetratricopeptide (TPR) repeat protein